MSNTGHVQVFISSGGKFPLLERFPGEGEIQAVPPSLLALCTFLRLWWSWSVESMGCSSPPISEVTGRARQSPLPTSYPGGSDERSRQLAALLPLPDSKTNRALSASHIEDSGVWGTSREQVEALPPLPSQSTGGGGTGAVPSSCTFSRSGWPGSSKCTGAFSCGCSPPGPWEEISHRNVILPGETLPGATSNWLELDYFSPGTAIFASGEKIGTSVCSWFLPGEQLSSQ